MTLIPTAEPFLLPGQPDRPACLLIHGFTGAPKEMRWMGEALNQHGFTCLGIRLTGHATRPRDMIRSRYTDWMASVEDGYHLLRGLTPDIFLVGLSMGGVLSLLMSAKLAPRVRGVVAMSTPFDLPDPHPAWQIQLFSYLKSYMRKTKGRPGEGWFDKNAYVDHISYPLNPIRSAAELAKLIGKMRAALPAIRVPVLLIHSRDDKYVPPQSMPRLYERLRVREKEMLWVSGSGHVVTRDAAREEVFSAAAAFIRQVTASNTAGGASTSTQKTSRA
ncbi:MAG: Thermostable monoacylglycerol lipase [Anaerolineales bacterium]|nr:Thermostable monoacylglycerol lipase [Anaerolineales bacterium]